MKAGRIAARKRIRSLLVIAIKIEKGILASGGLGITGLPAHTTLLRHAVLEMVSFLQQVLAERLSSTFESLPNTWDQLSTLQKSAIARHVHRKVNEALDDEDQLFSNADTINKYARKLQSATLSLHDPSRVGGELTRSSAQSFLRNNGSKELFRVVGLLGPSQMKFQDWLSKNHTNFRNVGDFLDTMITIRNEVAHGEIQIVPSSRDVRIYFLICKRLIGRFDDYWGQQ